MSHKHCIFCGEEVLNDGKLTPCNASNNTLPADTVGNRSHAVQSGAPFQPGATQPEHDGVAHETETFTNQRLFDLVRYKRSELHTDGLISDDEYAVLAQEHAAVARLEDYDSIKRKVADIPTLLERMARLVVAKLIPHQPLSDDNNEPWRCSMTDCEWKPVGEEPWVEWREHVRDVIESKLQQLREAVERP